MNEQKRDIVIGEKRVRESEGLGERLCANCEYPAEPQSCYCFDCETAIYDMQSSWSDFAHGRVFDGRP